MRRSSRRRRRTAATRWSQRRRRLFSQLRIEGLESRDLLTSGFVDFSDLEIDESQYSPSQVLVQFESEDAARRAAAVTSLEFSDPLDLVPGMRLVSVDPASSVERTIETLSDSLRVGVVEGDVQTDLDARRVARYGVPVVQIVTDGGCHPGQHLPSHLKPCHWSMRELLVDFTRPTMRCCSSPEIR